MRIPLASMGAVLTPIAASAHPDHAGSAGVGLVHYVTEPSHVATLVLTVGAVLLVVAAWRVHRRRALLDRPPG